MPSEKQIAQVQTLAICGYPEDDIARFLDIDPKTLRKYFRETLDKAGPLFIGNAVGKLHEAVNKGEAWAICFALKTKGKHLGFTERHEVTGKDGAPLFDLSALSDADLETWEALQRKALAGRQAQLPAPAPPHPEHDTAQ